MNLQENINRIKEVMGVINESKFFHRRVDLDKVKKLLPTNSQQVFYDTKSYEQFKYELTLRAVEYVMWDEHELGWENLPEQEEIEFVTEVSNIFDDIIKNLYKVMGGVINESQYSNNLKRRVHILDSLIDNLLPNMYPCDYNDEDDFFTGVYHELHHLIEDEQYGLENLDRKDMIEYIYENKQDEIREYYRERCENKEEETEGVGAYAAPAFEMKPDHVHFKHLYNEQAESKKDALKSMLQQSGIEVTSKLMGGIDNLINVLYDGDVMKFSEDTHTPLVYMSVDEMSLYIHHALVDKLGLDNANFSSKEKTLGKFRFGSKNSHLYAFTANLTPTRLHDQPYYKVVGTSGDSGFGYAFINKRNTLGKRYRQQIFKQIIDKYNLEPYMQLKTFY